MIFLETHAKLVLVILPEDAYAVRLLAIEKLARAIGQVGNVNPFSIPDIYPQKQSFFSLDEPQVEVAVLGLVST
ncbi:hypothetical protein AKJ44_01345 [candidate division MSBL1 archaeon SCGC-AAA261F17]|uniref:Uncharacterized protein n=1 Tax=candidate division MSBL1 archaeon SCGC-AAA261F17 TaxID=1698274 RepID=A0A133V6Q6_9EURY|nr:hypothetical protein AKJ44_01345 [candidate division MSBL1 archaeon SCGC-AAA261F17]